MTVLSKVYVRALLVIVTSLGCKPLFSQPSVLWGDLKPGEYAVGFTVLERYDTTRQWRAGKKGRPIQISVWYPAAADSSAPPLRYADYFLLSARELEFKELTEKEKSEALGTYRAMLVGAGIPREAVDSLFSSPVFGVPNLAIAKGPFPLVIVAQGNFHSAHHQSLLCEFLASHGYVVATCPSQTRISGPMKSDEDISLSMAMQAEDISFVRNQVVEKFTIDPARIGLVSHSFGARSAFLYATGHKEIKVLISLDGGIGNKQGKEFLIGLKGFAPGEFRVPILHFYEDIESLMTPDFDLINSLKHSERYLIKVARMHHLQFTSFGMAAGTIPGFADDKDEIRLKCEAMFRVALDFLDAFLNGQTVDTPSKLQESIREILPGNFMHLTRIGSLEDR
jgi:pimeloyl-ACP methyl ester carboxylesterase